MVCNHEPVSSYYQTATSIWYITILFWSNQSAHVMVFGFAGLQTKNAPVPSGLSTYLTLMDVEKPGWSRKYSLFLVQGDRGADILCILRTFFDCCICGWVDEQPIGLKPGPSHFGEDFAQCC